MLATLHGQLAVVRVAGDDVFFLDAIDRCSPLALCKLLLQPQFNLARCGQLEGLVGKVQRQDVGDRVMPLRYLSIQAGLGAQLVRQPQPPCRAGQALVKRAGPNQVRSLEVRHIAADACQQQPAIID